MAPISPQVAETGLQQGSVSSQSEESPRMCFLMCDPVTLRPPAPGRKLSNMRESQDHLATFDPVEGPAEGPLPRREVLRIDREEEDGSVSSCRERGAILFSIKPSSSSPHGDNLSRGCDVSGRIAPD